MDSPYRFLFDECLTADLVAVARNFGHIASHVRYINRLGASDQDVTRWAIEHDHAVVTNNRRDYLRIYRDLDLHPGLVVIVPNVSPPRQCHLFDLALLAIETEADLINRLVEVAEDGIVTISDYPPP